MGAYLYCFTSELHLVKKDQSDEKSIGSWFESDEKSQLNVGLKLEKD